MLRRLLSLVVVISLSTMLLPMMLLPSLSVPAFAGGSGIEGVPSLIETAEQPAPMADKINAEYKVSGSREYQFTILLDSEGSSRTVTDGKFIYSHLDMGFAGWRAKVYNIKGEMILSPDYDYVFSGSVFSEGLLNIGKTDNGKCYNYGYIDESGNVAIDFIYQEADAFSCGVAVVKKAGKYGCIDRSGNVVIDFIYDDIKRFEDGQTMAYINRGYVVIDTQGNIIPRDATYMYMSPFINGYAFVRREPVYHYERDGYFLDLNERSEYYYVSTVASAMELENAEHGYGFIDREGNVIYDFVLEAEVKNDQEYMGHGATRTIVSFRGSFFTEAGTAVVKQDGVYRLIDTSGNLIRELGDEVTELPIRPKPPSPGLYPARTALVSESDPHYSRTNYYDKDGNLLYYNDHNNKRAYDAQDNEIFPYEIDIYRTPDFDNFYTYNRSDPRSVYYDMGQGLITINKIPNPPANIEGNYVCMMLSSPLINANGHIRTLEEYNYVFKPIIKSGRTLVPIRVVAESMGADVDWNDDTRTVTIVKDGTVVTMRIDNTVITKNGDGIALDVPPMLMSGRTLVPLRAVAESFGSTVDWNDDQELITITYR